MNSSAAETAGRALGSLLYNILENLCISRGIPMPKLKVMVSDALNAFATGMNAKQYSITVTTGLLKALNDDEIDRENSTSERPGARGHHEEPLSHRPRRGCARHRRHARGDEQGLQSSQHAWCAPMSTLRHHIRTNS
jgi:Peptidase family M48